MNEFVRRMKYQMTDKGFHQRDAANLGLLGYDLGRAKSEEEENNARKEYNFRSRIVVGYTVKEAIELERKYR